MSDTRDNGRGKGGPKTAAGKQVSRGNGIRHGLRSKLLRAGVAVKIAHCPVRLRGCDCQGRGLSMGDPCPVLGAARDELARAIRAERQIKPVHAFLVDLLLDDVVAVLLARLWIGTVGLIRLEGTAVTLQPLEPALARRRGEIVELAKALGLTPIAAQTLKDDALDVGPSLEAIRAEYAAADAAEPPAPAGGEGPP